MVAESHKQTRSGGGADPRAAETPRRPGSVARDAREYFRRARQGDRSVWQEHDRHRRCGRTLAAAIW